MKTLAKLLVLAILTIGLCTVLACPSGTSATTCPNATSADKPRMAAFSPGQVGPFVIPASWKQATWFVDPANVSTCASDNNRTCSASACTAGDGPCLTYGSIATRWGTYAPRLRQNTTVTFMSSQAAGDGDPVYAHPFIENQSFLRITGTPTTAATGTLGAITAKNRSTPQLLNAVLTPGTGSIAVNQLLIDTTHSGEAWVYTDVAGTTWSLSQPLAPESTTAFAHFLGNIAAEQDSFTIGDSYTTVTFPSVQLSDLEPIEEQWSGAGTPSFGGGIYVDNVHVINTGHGTSAPLILGTPVLLGDVLSDRMIAGTGTYRAAISQASSSWGYSQELYNVNATGGFWPLGQPVLQVSAMSASCLFLGGIIQGTNQVRLGNADLEQDIIVNGDAHGVAAIGSGRLAGVELDSGGIIVAGGNITITTDLNSGNSTVWGPGSLFLGQNTRASYPSGAGAAVANLLFKGTYQISGQTKTCIGIPSVATPTFTCNVTLSAANLDANLGGTSGCLFVEGGASFCNFGN